MANPIDDRAEARRRQQWKTFKKLGIEFIQCNYCEWTTQKSNGYPAACPGCKAIKQMDYETTIEQRRLI